MTTRGKAAMTERILETCDRLFYQRGIRAIGVDTVAAEAGISKRTLYDYFPSKDELITAYMARRMREIAPSDLPPGEQILGFFDGLERWFASRGFRGCPFVNAVTELGQPKHPAAAIALTAKERRRDWFRDRAAELGVTDAGGVATQLAILMDGAIAAALVRGDPSMGRAAKQAARTLLVAAGAKLGAKRTGAKQPRGRRRAAARK